MSIPADRLADLREAAQADPKRVAKILWRYALEGVLNRVRREHIDTWSYPPANVDKQGVVHPVTAEDLQLRAADIVDEMRRTLRASLWAADILRSEADYAVQWRAWLREEWRFAGDVPAGHAAREFAVTKHVRELHRRMMT